MKYDSGVEQRQLARLITLRHRFDSCPRNKVSIVEVTAID